jgi:hypothetical protein
VVSPTQPFRPSAPAPAPKRFHRCMPARLLLPLHSYQRLLCLLQGTLRGYDQATNLILDECHERVYSSKVRCQCWRRLLPAARPHVACVGLGEYLPRCACWVATGAMQRGPCISLVIPQQRALRWR